MPTCHAGDALMEEIKGRFHSEKDGDHNTFFLRHLQFGVVRQRVLLHYARSEFLRKMIRKRIPSFMMQKFLDSSPMNRRYVGVQNPQFFFCSFLICVKPYKMPFTFDLTYHLNPICLVPFFGHLKRWKHTTNRNQHIYKPLQQTGARTTI